MDSSARPQPPSEPERPSILGHLFNLALLYILVVVAAGTLINTGLPVAVETGAVLKTIMLVEPSIEWAEEHRMRPLAGGLRMLAQGLPIAPAEAR